MSHADKFLAADKNKYKFRPAINKIRDFTARTLSARSIMDAQRKHTEPGQSMEQQCYAQIKCWARNYPCLNVSYLDF